MIQRKQTIWLLLCAIAAFFFIRIPLYIAKLADSSSKYFSTTESLPLFTMGAVGGLLALVSVFLFKNRKMQLRLCSVGLVSTFGLLALEVQRMNGFKNDNPLPTTVAYYWGALLPMAMMVFFILAIVNIRKDEKLIKSLERFR